MKNILDIDGCKAVISLDPDIGLFRGEFLGLSGGADFYAKDLDGLMEEGRLSLRIYLDDCAARGIEPYKAYSGRFNLRLDPTLHAAAASAAAAEQKSLNEWIAEKIRAAAEAA
jgi:predicted HicB family RNase H-like nuclease